MKTMTKEEFKKRWESDDVGGGIDFDDVADCAEAWGLFRRPRTSQINKVLYSVLKAANVEDAEAYNTDREEEEA
jgi:hypothetical protein